MTALDISAGRLAIALGNGEKDELSTLLQHPAAQRSARAVLVLAHGAGADLKHRTMSAIAAALANVNIATLRCNFPFKEHGRNRVDDVATSVATLCAAVSMAMRELPATPVLLGGHSFGGRMASHAAAQAQAPQVRGLIYFAFPLHAADKPAVTRAAHLKQIDTPMLFLSGTRDALASAALLAREVAALGDCAQLHWLHDADHSYATRQRQRVGRPDVFAEMGSTVAAWLDHIAL